MVKEPIEPRVELMYPPIATFSTLGFLPSLCLLYQQKKSRRNLGKTRQNKIKQNRTKRKRKRKEKKRKEKQKNKDTQANRDWSESGGKRQSNLRWFCHFFTIGPKRKEKEAEGKRWKKVQSKKKKKNKSSDVNATAKTTEPP